MDKRTENMMRVRKKILLFAASFLVAVVVLGVAVPYTSFVNAQEGPCQTDAQCNAGMKCVSNACVPEDSSEAEVNSSVGTAEATISTVRLPVIGFIIRAVFVFVIYVLGVFVKLVAGLADVVLSFNRTILDFDPPFILIGWVFFRDIANLGFVFGIIVIAVATILRIQGYQAQRILLKLIAAALLVNFSLVLAGSIIRVADVFSQFFMDKMTSGGTFSIGTKLTQGFKIPELTVKPDEGSGVLERIASAALGPDLFEVSALALTAVFLILIFLTLLAFSGMLFVRFLHLSFLLMISPLVWLLWIFPHTQNHWKKWWSTFLHWTFYAPIVLVFVWVSMTVIEKANTYAEQATQAINAAAGGFGDQVYSVAHVQLGTLVASLMGMALLLGGMKMAQAMGYGGTALVMNSSQKIGNWAKTKARRGAARAGHLMYRPVERGISKWTPKGWLGKKTAGFVQRKAIETGAALQKEATGGMEEARKRYGSYDKDHMQRVAGTLTGPERDQVLQMLAEKGWMDKDFIERMGGEGKIVKLKDQFVRYGKGKDFESIENAVGRTKESQDAMEEYDDALASKDTARINKAKEELSKARQKFLDRLKGDEWANVGKAITGKIPKSDAEKEYFAQVAEHINRDPSGKAFYSPVAQLKGHNLHDFVGSLYAATLPADDVRREAFEGMLNTARRERDAIRQQENYESILGDVVQKLEAAEKSKTLTRDQERLLKRVRRTVVDDIVGMTTMQQPPAPGAGPAPTPIPPPQEPTPKPSS